MISYSTVQRPFARQLHERLTECGCNPKLDHLDIAMGDRWRQTIAWWLSACQAAVVLLSEEAIASPWVRYELSVLSNRALLERNVRLVLVYLGVSPADVHRRPGFEPFQLGEVQSYHEIPDDNPDEDTLAALVKSIHEVAEVDDPPVDRLVARVRDELQEVASDRVANARSHLHATADDPWLIDADDVRHGFAQAFCSTPLNRTYRSLQTLALDRHLAGDDVAELIDLNVMTTFDSRVVDQLHRAALGQVRRSMVTATTRGDLADVAVQTLEELRGTLHAYRFEVNGPITGLTATDVAESLADELCHAIETSLQENPDQFLAAVARREHPVFALLTSAVGITSHVLSLLEARFPSVIFVVLSSPSWPMPKLAEDLGLEGTGADLPDEAAWSQYVAHERALATERTSLRQDLLRVKKAARR